MCFLLVSPEVGEKGFSPSGKFEVNRPAEGVGMFCWFMFLQIRSAKQDCDSAA
jgi:hypothetical protein